MNYVASLPVVMDNYTRATAMAVASLPQTGAHRTVMMCTYGTLNGASDCAGAQMTSALRAIGFTGIVRSDLDTGVPTGQMWAAGVTLLKPLNGIALGKLSALPAPALASLRHAAISNLSLSFAAGLVVPDAVKNWSAPTGLSTGQQGAGSSAARAVEQAGAVLLKYRAGHHSPTAKRRSGSHSREQRHVANLQCSRDQMANGHLVGDLLGHYARQDLVEHFVGGRTQRHRRITRHTHRLLHPHGQRPVHDQRVVYRSRQRHHGGHHPRCEHAAESIPRRQ